MKITHIMYIKHSVTCMIVGICIMSVYNSVSKPVGLVNLGQSCYMNSVLQVLFHTKELNKYFLNINNAGEGTLSKYFHDFLKTYNDLQNDKFFYPIDIHKQINTICQRDHIQEVFCDNMAHDANELLLWFLQKLDTEQTKKLDPEQTVDNCMDNSIGPIKNLFAIRTITDNVEFDVKLPLLAQNIQEIITHYNNSGGGGVCSSCCKRYYVDIRNLISWYFKGALSYNESYNNIFIINDIAQICETSKYLILSIGEPSTFKNNDIMITTPIQLDMAEYILNENKGSTRYKLYAVIRHIGFASYSHYEAVVENAGEWFLCDNKNVTKIHRHIEKNRADRKNNDLSSEPIQQLLISTDDDILSKQYSDKGVMFFYERIE